MTRSRWPLYSVVTVGIIVLTGVVLWQMSIPPGLRGREPYDVRQLGLGSKATLVATMATDCETCAASVDFYKELMAMTEMGGVARSSPPYERCSPSGGR